MSIHTPYIKKFSERTPRLHEPCKPLKGDLHVKQINEFNMRKDEHFKNEKVIFEAKKEKLKTFLTNATKEDLLDEIVSLHISIENMTDPDQRCGGSETIYNYNINTRNWLTQFYLFGKNTSNKDKLHDLLNICEPENADLLDTVVNNLKISNENPM